MPEGDPVANIVENFYNLFDAESTYPAGLRHCQSLNLSHPYPTDCFLVFNPCLQLDAGGITPFLPYIIRGDLNRLLCDDSNLPSTPPDLVGLPNPVTN